MVQDTLVQRFCLSSLCCQINVNAGHKHINYSTFQDISPLVRKYLFTCSHLDVQRNRGSKTFAAPTSPGGTKFFNHFPSNFLRPYGVAGPALDHHTLQRRINPVCCELLKPPHTAMSEFAATMVDNFNFLAATGKGETPSNFCRPWKIFKH